MRSAPAVSCLPAIVALAACAGPPLVLTPAASAPEEPPVVALLPLANEDPHPEAMDAGRKIRWAIYTALASRHEEYSVALQDVAETDRRLVAAGLTDSAAAALPLPDLCRLLEVNAVMKGTVTRYQKKGTAGQVATMVLFRWAKGSEVSVDVAIYDGADGHVIWRRHVDAVGGWHSAPGSLEERVGTGVARKFPFKKAR